MLNPMNIAATFQSSKLISIVNAKQLKRDSCNQQAEEFAEDRI